MRIVSLSPSSTEILYALGAADDLVGVTRLCNYPTAAQGKEPIGSWLQTSPERIVALQPDLIVSTTFYPKELAALVLTEKVLHLQPRGLSGVYESILQLGTATGRYQAAHELVQRMQYQLENLRVSAPAPALTVYCEEWPDPPMIAGNWLPELVELVGGKPVGGVHCAPSVPVDVDALRAADPDLMIFHWCQAEERRDLDQVRQRPGWQKFRAVQANALVRIPKDILNRPGPRLVEGARALQSALLRYQRLR